MVNSFVKRQFVVYSGAQCSLRPLWEKNQPDREGELSVTHLPIEECELPFLQAVVSLFQKSPLSKKVRVPQAETKGFQEQSLLSLNSAVSQKPIGWEL